MESQQTIPKSNYLLVDRLKSYDKNNVHHKVEKAFRTLDLPKYVSGSYIELLVYGRSWHLAGDMEDYFFLWNHQPLMYKRIGYLTKHHRVNQIPGMSYIANKANLYVSYFHLQQKFGSEEFDFMPSHFRLPEEKKWYEAANEERKKVAPNTPSDPDFGKRWIMKDLTQHRGIQLVSENSIQRTLDQGRSVGIAEYVEPMLMHGRRFDVGLYVGITSIDPLRFYVFDQVVHRILSEKYPDVLDDKSPLESYVVGFKYSQFYEMDELIGMYDPSKGGMPNRTHIGRSHLDVVKEYMDSEGFNGQKALDQMEDAIIKMITGMRHRIQMAPPTGPLYYGYEDKEKKTFESWRSFVELIRFDFVIDSKGEAVLMEVNMSPDLSSKDYEKSGGSCHFMDEAVAYDFISMVTYSQQLAQQPEIPYDELYCQDRCSARDILTENTMHCWKCPGWYDTVDERMDFALTLLERGQQGRFHSVYPPTDPESPYPKYLRDESRLEKDLRWYLSHNQGPFGPDVIGSQSCFEHGQFVNGACQCAEGYTGNSCFNRIIPLATDPPTVDVIAPIHYDVYLTGLWKLFTRLVFFRLLWFCCSRARRGNLSQCFKDSKSLLVGTKHPKKM